MSKDYNYELIVYFLNSHSQASLTVKAPGIMAMYNSFLWYLRIHTKLRNFLLRTVVVTVCILNSD